MVCKQCINAPCIAKCPVQALYKDKITMSTLLNKDKCIGCGICVEACPFSAVALDTEGHATICDLCGGFPECAAVCASGAIKALETKKIEEAKRIDFATIRSDEVLKKWGLE